MVGGWVVGGGWVLDFARIKLTQPSLAGAGAELGNNAKQIQKRNIEKFKIRNKIKIKR